jgi:hypothetical protein
MVQAAMKGLVGKGKSAAQVIATDRQLARQAWQKYGEMSAACG